MLCWTRASAPFAEDEVSLLTAFADQAALALGKARLLKEAETERERADSLYRVSNLLAGAHDTDEVLDLIVNEAARLVNVPYMIVRLLEGGVLVARAATKAAAAFAAEAPVQPVEFATDAAGHAMSTKEPIHSEELIPPEIILRLREYGFYGTGVIPLLAEGRSIGTLSVADWRPRLLTDDETALLSAFADQASLAIEKARMLNEAETERERADSLYRVSNLLAGAHDTDEVLDLIVNEAARFVGATGGYLRLLQGDGLVVGAETESMADYCAEIHSVQPIFTVDATSAMGYVMATKEPWTATDIATDEMVAPVGWRLNQKYGWHGGAVVPLIANDKSIGVLAVVDSRLRQFTEDEISLLTAFADQAALALDKARLLSEAEARERQATQLYEVTTQLASNHDLDSVLDLITQQAVELLGARGALLYKFDQGRGGLVPVTVHNLPPIALEIFVPPGQGNVGRAYEERRAFWTDSMWSDADAAENDQIDYSPAAQITVGWGVVGVVAAPIVIKDEVYGILQVVFDQHREFTNEEVNLVQNLADSAAVAISNARFIDETQRARDEATELYEITEQLASSPDMDSVLDLITAKATEMLKSLGSSILRFDQGSDSLMHAKSHNVPPALVEQYAGRSGEGVSGLAFQERRPAWSSDISTDQNLTQTEGATRQAIDQAGLRGVLAVPVIVRDQPYGVLDVIYQETHEFTEADIRLLQTLADSASVAIGNARFIEETQQARDEATQLYEITEQLASSPDMDSVLDLITVKATDLLGSDGASILRFDEETGALVHASAHNTPTGLAEEIIILPGEGAMGRAFLERRPVRARDSSSEPALNHFREDARLAIANSGVNAALSVPVIVRDEAYGVLNVFYYESPRIYRRRNETTIRSG